MNGQMNEKPLPTRRTRILLLALALACLVAGFSGFLVDPVRFFRSYLVGYLFWLQLALGSLALLMLHRLTGGAWGLTLEPLLKAATRTFLALAILFVPVLVGVREIYPWANWTIEAEQWHQALYLNIPGFVVRAIFYFFCWLLLYDRIVAHPHDGNSPGLDSQRLRKWSAVGLIAYALTTTFAAIDWVMSLDPHWRSTAYGLIFMVAQGLLALAFSVFFFALTRSGSARFPKEKSAPPLKDLGNLVLAFVIFWSYLSFFQYFIIWNGNLPEEVTWVIQRTRNGWEGIVLALALFQLALPFALLLFRPVKQNLRVLGGICAIIVGARLADIYWYVAPSLETGGILPHWMTIVTFTGVGAIWFWIYLRHLQEAS